MQKQELSPDRLAIFSKIREPLSAITHLAGLIAALAGLPYLLVLSQGRPAWVIALLVYGASLCLMFAASTIYHTVIAASGVIRTLRKIDHSAIFLLIAGSYTPFCVIAFTGFWQTGFLFVIWGLAALGIVSKLFFMRTPRWLTAGIYIVMGWLSIFAMREMLAVLPGGALFWLVTGGLAYTSGAMIYITKKMDFVPGFFGFHEVWHLFVLFGAFAHYLAVLNLVRGY